MTQDVHKRRKEKYCEITKTIKPLIGKYGGVFLKLFNYSENESPSDVDIFVPPGNVLGLLKDLVKMFNAKFIKKRRFLTSSIEVVLPRNINEELHIDLYYEFVFTPSHRVATIENTIYTKIPWCEEFIEVPAPSQGFHAFFIMWHALRHRVLALKDMMTLIELFDSFDRKDLIEFLFLIKRSKLELEFIEMLYILLHMAMSMKVKRKALRTIIIVIKYLSSNVKRRRLAGLVYHYIVARQAINKTTYYNLTLLNAIKTFRDISRVSKIKDLYYLLRIAFVLSIREYVILLLLKLGII